MEWEFISAHGHMAKMSKKGIPLKYRNTVSPVIFTMFFIHVYLKSIFMKLCIEELQIVYIINNIIMVCFFLLKAPIFIELKGAIYQI